jgi:uncharacterized membrane protein YbaN (DUF454 family)
MKEPTVAARAAAIERPAWQRALWMAAGGLSLAMGLVGVVLPLLPTTPLVLLAAFCFSRGSERCERWIVEHPQLGPLVRDWRETRAVPLRAKQLGIGMMAIGATWAAFSVPAPWNWMPAAVCTPVGVWLWRLPTRRPRPREAAPPTPPEHR